MEGWAALVLKEDAPGSLKSQPLAVLSTVYRLWAGVRPEEVIRWQETSAHPVVFGFCPGRGSLGGAAITHMLLELCRLRSWTVAEMSVDYKKCFDLISQAVVLRAVAELGLAPEICRALGAMYWQLRRGFKLTGCLGQCWRAGMHIVGDPRQRVDGKLEGGDRLPPTTGMRPHAGIGRRDSCSR